MEISPIIIWFIVGLVLILMEFVIPGLVIVFFGFGAWVTAIFVAIFPNMEFWVEMMIFTVFSVVTLVLLRRSLKKRFFSDQEGAENEGVDDYIGKTAVVEVAIKDGAGKVDFRGATWAAFADEDIPKGTKVTIIGKDSIKLKVKPLK
jgi:membrane protein implicated in regulation of membrane protease activity